MGILWEKEAISVLFKTIIFLAILFLPEGSFAQSVDSNDKAVPSVEDNSLENKQDYPVKDEQAPSFSLPSKESPIILEKSDNTRQKEGIGDAFSQDHKDRFQLKNEKTNKSESGKEKPDG